MHAWKQYVPFLLAYALLTWLVSDHIFFWDTVQLASRHAHWYFENDFRYFFLPEKIDSGHPPYFGMGLALCWKLFGRSLEVSHFYMLPFLFANVVLWYQVGKYFIPRNILWVWMLMVFVDPFILGQSILVSPDNVLICFFLISFLGILQERRWLLLIGTFGLAAISTRGMMIVFSLFLFEVIIQYLDEGFSFKKAIAKLITYIPSGLFAIAFLYAHYQHAGWIGYHENSSWAGSFERVGLSGFLKNIGLAGWRLLDFGRVILWLISAGVLGFIFIKKIKLDKQARNLMILILVLCFVLLPSMLIHKSLTAHRYLMPITLVFNLLTMTLICKQINSVRWKNLAMIFCVAAFITGNFWVYPRSIAQGWDATFAHYPYYSLRSDMMNYIIDEGIPIENIGTDFPNRAPLKILELSNIEKALPIKDFKKQEYILYSNVYNNFSDHELAELEQEWIIQKQLNWLTVEVILYRKQ